MEVVKRTIFCIRFVVFWMIIFYVSEEVLYSFCYKVILLEKL